MFKRIASVWLLGSLAAAIAPVSGVAAEEPVSLAKRQIVYTSKGRRDPFVQPQAGRLRNVMTRVDIGILRLTGIIRGSQQTTALLTSQNGPRFGYLLKEGRLYTENHQAVAGITGEIVSTNEVVLSQHDRQVRLRLRAP